MFTSLIWIDGKHHSQVRTVYLIDNFLRMFNKDLCGRRFKEWFIKSFNVIGHILGLEEFVSRFYLGTPPLEVRFIHTQYY